MSDTDLLRRFVRQKDQAAFTELVRRHINLVYGAARRYLNGDARAAEDVTQQVFIDLARKAERVTEHSSVVGWLYACTRFNAMTVVRTERRRSEREREFAMTTTAAPPADWVRIQPVIDDALQELDERERQLVLRRFFGQESFATIAHHCQLSENAAQKAVARALDILNGALAKRGIASTAAALEIALAQAAVAAPTSLAESVTAAALSGMSTSVLATSGIAVAAKFAFAMSAAAGVALTVGFWRGEQRQLEAEIRDTLRRDQQTAVQQHRMNDRLREEMRRATLAEADTAALLRAIEQDRVEREAARRVQQASAPNPMATPAANIGTTAYTVQPRDTFARIARAYGVATTALIAANPNYDFRRMRVGEVIMLPPGAALQDPVATGALPGTVGTANSGK